jgi:subtilisin family serine protease
VSSSYRTSPRSLLTCLFGALLILSACGTDATETGATETDPALSTTPVDETGPATSDVPRATAPTTSAAPVSTTTTSAASPVTAPALPLPLSSVSDPLRVDQWALDSANIPAAWATTGGAGVTIAIIDTGVDLDHPDLIDRLVPGYDFVDNDDVPDDDNGHGTHVAGSAAASANTIGGVGAAPMASIMPIRVLDTQGSGSDEQIAAGIEWAVANGADVINLSLGEAGFISRFTKGGKLNAAIRSATASGVVVVAAAGNEGSAGNQYRIGVDVLVVNATDRDDSVASFSNVGDVRSISAPGVDILSTAPVGPSTLWPAGSAGYERLDGTSMATPLVAGVAALALSAGIPSDEVVDRLMATARQPSEDPKLGAGIVDAGAAIDLSVAGDAGTTQPTLPSTSSTLPPISIPEVPEGAGAIAVTISSPVDIDVSVPAPVTCSVDGRVYRAAIDLAALENGATFAASLSVVNYRGPGSYPAVGSITIRIGENETTVPVAGVADIDANLGGTMALSIPLEGQSVEMTLGWTCKEV